MKPGDRVIEPLVSRTRVGTVDSIARNVTTPNRVFVRWDTGRQSWHNESDLRAELVPPFKIGDRVRRRARQDSPLGIVCGLFGELDDDRTHQFQVQWDDEDGPQGPYAAEHLDRVNDLERPETSIFGPNKLELRAGEGKIELLVNGRDLAPEISHWELSEPNELGEAWLTVKYPVEVPEVEVGPAKEEPMKEEWGLADRNGQVGPVFSTVEEAKKYRDEYRHIKHPRESRIARRFVSEWEVGE